MANSKYTLILESPEAKEVICEFSADSINEAISAGLESICFYCDINTIAPPYIRYWEQAEHIIFDYGSYSKFFILYPER